MGTSARAAGAPVRDAAPVVRAAGVPLESATMAARNRSRRVALGSIALSALTAACASTHTAPKPFPMPGGTGDNARVERPVAPPDDIAGSDAAADARTATPAVREIVELALELRGTPYRNGGADPDGFDCSGFTQYVFAQAGRPLPRETRQQYEVGEPVRLGDQQPGDLIFFTTVAPGASHVGISLGHDAFVHAPSSRGVVRVESLDVSYWSRRLIGIRRVTEE